MKNNINPNIELGQIVEFYQIFPEDEMKSPVFYLKGGSRSKILTVAALFLGFNPNNSKFHNTEDILKLVFSTENNDFANNIFWRIKALESTGTNYRVINNFSSLKLFETFFQIEEQVETQNEFEFEINLFKAYLALNSEWLQKQQVAFASTEHLEIDFKIPASFFSFHYPFADKVNYDIGEIWITQSVKAVWFFQFLETNNKSQVLLKVFLDYFQCSSWVDYLKNVIQLTIPAIQNSNDSYNDIAVNPGEKFNSDCAFIEKLIVENNDKLDENDFLTLRAKPFYKIQNGLYRIIYNLFVVEKIYNGVYFLLKERNDILTKQTGKIPDLKSFIGKEFSEKTLSYKIINTIYPEKSNIKVSGQQMDDAKIDGAIDFYIRRGKNILLFESKDFLIRAAKKASFDFEIYEEEFERILYYKMHNGKEENKAVMQLINNVRKVLKNQFQFDKSYNYKDVHIYPILLTHYRQYDTPGFNDLVNYWFQYELKFLRDEGLFINHVKPLVVINIDSLLYYQADLNHTVRLHEIIEKYHAAMKIDNNLKFESFDEIKKYRLSKLSPFSHFMHSYFYNLKIFTPPPTLDILGPALFASEYDSFVSS